MKLITVICPVHNEELCAPIFYERLCKVAESVKDRYEFEIIFVNNRSTDRTLELLLGYRKKDPRVQILTMSRNFTYQPSLQAGFTHASGDAIVAIDVDCEDPPEMLPQFLAKWEEGYDVVYGSRSDRVENWIIKKLRRVFYRVLKLTADVDIVLYMAEFALISSVVRDAIISNNNAHNYLRAEIGYAGFSRFGIEYVRHQRAAGKTHYHFGHMIVFTISTLVTASTVMLRLPFYFFPFLFLFNVVMLALARGNPLSGYFSSLVVTDILYATLLLTAQGSYLARIYKNGIARPYYILDPKHTYLTKTKKTA